VENYDVQARMRALNWLGNHHDGKPMYTDEEIANAPALLKGKNEEDAVVAYLQSLGVGYMNAWRQRDTTAAANTK
jgi:cytochrome c oxidase cbb3-type subunit 2